MRYISVVVLCIGASWFSTPAVAQSDTLTNERAQAAIDQRFEGDGQGTVMGVLEIPAQNAARVDITLSGFVWNAPKNDAVTAYVMGAGGGQHVYNGAATATFIHYTDGRWILVRIETPVGTFDGLNIAAP